MRESTKNSISKKVGRVESILIQYANWLEKFGETSYDHQSFFAGPIGGKAKGMYYKHGAIGIAAVAPMIFFEAFLPSARRLFHKKMRFPIADSHYAMGFAFLYEITGDKTYLNKAIHFLEILKTTRCNGYGEYCWGYPFDWVTRNGVLKEHTPMITSNPYIYEAFDHVNRLDPKQEWEDIMHSIVRHALTDIKDFKVSERSSTCSYTPFDEGGVINSSAYRSGMLAKASVHFREGKYWTVAERNVRFVLENQNPDGSWYYAADSVRDFVDHFHTCFVMKGLAKVHEATGDDEVLKALEKGVEYYLKNLFDDDGLPKPFSKAPRMTVYKRELYDCAECINLCLMLRKHFPVLNEPLERLVTEIVDHWIQDNGSFRARKLHLGWDNVPMHRWGQSQMLRSLSYYVKDSRDLQTTGTN